jgi:hypothetical protein
VDQPFDMNEELVHESMIRTGQLLDTRARGCAQREAPVAKEVSELMFVHKGRGVYARFLCCQAELFDLFRSRDRRGTTVK